MTNQLMSLESVLDQERKDVLALLEGGPPRRARATSGSVQVPSPKHTVRSMLDINTDPPPAARSSLTVDSRHGLLSPGPKSAPIRSMLDIDGTSPVIPSSRRMPDTRSVQTFPAEPHRSSYFSHGVNIHGASDPITDPLTFRPQAKMSNLTPESAFQFSGYLPSNPGGPVFPKRNTLASKKSALALPGAMTEVVRGDLFASKDRGRQSSIGSALGLGKSRSPLNRWNLRSLSPSGPTPIVLNDGRVLDRKSAYRRLSDANLARSAGSLATLAPKNRRTHSGDALAATVDTDARLDKPDEPLEGEDVATPVDSSDYYESDEDNPRGRTKTNDSAEQMPLTPVRSNFRTAQSLMAAAEEERQEIAAQNTMLNEKFKIKSLLEPEVVVTGTRGLLKVSKPGVHPNTSFDDGGSGLNTPHDTDTEADLSDIHRAQKLAINTTAITSTPSTKRCVRSIYRGDFAKMHQEAQENQRRVRKYLVATDLSDEAAHALEWTIGTVLRDGDTLLAIYCVDEEVGIAPNDISGDDQIKEQVAAIGNSTRPCSTPILGPTLTPNSLESIIKGGSTSTSADPSPMGRERGKAEQERYKAVQDITDKVSRLLRKTKLQVKVVIEVIHCKCPKHLITEVIDYISPTLVILGSRGRSALKGVILGSFSNYLVTKSSVPVMVARKRLRKLSKYKRPSIRLANNLENTNPSLHTTLAAAKID